MEYILHYDVAAIFIICVVGILFYSKKYFPSPSNRAFSFLLINLLISSVSDLVSVYGIENADTFPVGLNYIISILFYISYNLCAVIYLYYTMTLVKIVNTKLGRRLRQLLLAVGTFVILYIGSTPFTRTVFYFENGEYMHGNGNYILIPLGMLEIGGAMILSLWAQKRITLSQKLTTYAFGIMIACGIVIQIRFPQYLIVNFLGSIMLLLIFQTLQNPSEYISPDTGIYNQKAFLEMLDMQFVKNKSLTILAFQLEGFQFVDQFMGAENGNNLLSSVSTDCSNNLQGTLYHLDGTRFALILNAECPRIQENIEWLNWRFLSTFKVCGVAVSLVPRICAVNYPQIAKNKEEMLNAIHYALKEAKDKNSTDVVWASLEAIEEQKRSTMVNHILSRAVINREFEVYYQPIYCTRDTSFRASEALIRLRDEKLGFISPEEFIPIAEQNGLILEIGDIVFTKVCEFIASGVPEKLGVQYIEVNLSVVQCMQESLHQHLTEIMDKYGVPYHMIDFEITETFANGDTGTLVKNMNELISLGCTFAMDDYGTGFSNNDYLMEFPFKLIKLDKSFVWSTLSSEKASKILTHTVAMMKSLELLIVAEGVETAEQKEMLERLQCDYLQGYYFSKPLPEQEYVAYLQNAEQFLAELNRPKKAPKRQTRRKSVKKSDKTESNEIE